MATGVTGALGRGSALLFDGGVAGGGVERSRLARSARGLCVDSRFEDALDAGVAGDLGDPTGARGGDWGGVNVFERFLECLFDW